MGNRYSYKQTFEEWCLENNRQDILDLWDYEKNDVKPSEIPYGTKRKYFFKCHNGIHESESKRISSITEKADHRLICKQCEKEGRYKKDLTGMTFRELSVIKKDEERSNNPSRTNYYICECSCGNTSSVNEYELMSGKKLTCAGKSGHRMKLSDITKISDLRKTPEYGRYRRAVLKRDGHRCIITGEVDPKAEVHHLYSFADYPATRFDPANGVCVSKKYHSVASKESFHAEFGRYGNTPDQFEEFVNKKRKELGIEEYFDVYEFMNSYDSDNLEIDDSMLDIEDLKGENKIMRNYYVNTRNVFDRYNAIQDKIKNHIEETNTDEDEFLQNFCIYFAHALIKDTGFGGYSRDELGKVCDIINDVIR